MYPTIPMAIRSIPMPIPTPYNEDSYMMNAEDMDMNIDTGADMKDIGTDMMGT